MLRLKNIYLDKDFAHSTIDLVLSGKDVTVAKTEGLLKALEANRIDEQTELVQAYQRMYNLVKDVEYTGVKEELFKEAAETALYEAAVKAKATSDEALEAADFATVVNVPTTLVGAINKFFEDVMVMDKDEAVKANRLQLVRLAYEVMAVIGDISALK